MSYPVFFSSIYLAGGLLIFLMGFVILRENPRSAVNRATALMLFAGALGSVLGALSRLLESTGAGGPSVTYASYLRNFAYLWEFFFPSLLYLALVYPLRQVPARRLHALEAALYVPHVCHLALVLFFGDGTRFDRLFDAVVGRLGAGMLADSVSPILEIVGVLLTLVNKVHQQLFSLVNLAYAMLAIALMHRSRQRVANPRVRGQVSIVLVGLTVCVMLYTAAKLLPVFFPYRPSTGAEAALISIALLVASGAIAWAIVRHKFLDMQSLARRSILYGATAVVFAVVYLLVIRQVTRFSATVFGSNVQVIEAGFLVLSVIVFQPLLTSLEDLIEGMLRRRRGDPQLLIQNLARDLAAEVDLRGMRESVSTSLKHGLLVEDAWLWTVEESLDGVVLDGGDRRLLVQPDSPLAGLVRFFETSPEPALRHDVERSLPALSEADRQALSAAIRGLVLLVPLTLQGRLRGLLGVGAKLTGGRFHLEDMGLLSLLANQISTSLENVRLLSENVQKRLLEEEISLASEIQRGLLPTTFPERHGYRAHGVSLASKFVGGDYFDVFALQESRLNLAIADVSGKGVPAAILMSYLQAALRSNVLHLDSPARVLERINSLLYASTAPEKFATFFYAVLNTETHELVYANAGHNYPIILGADGNCCELVEGELPLGILPDVGYSDGSRRLKPGDTLFLYTDGITEATNDDDEEFGAERLHEVLCRHCGSDPHRLVEAVLGEVRAFTNGADPGDDLTMVVVARTPSPVAEQVGADVAS